MTLVALVTLGALATACATPASDSSSAAVELTIFHLNDLHARLVADDRGRGGFAEVAGLLRREREAATGPHLTLHAGDLVQGTPVSTLFEGVPVVELANGLGIDVHCLGNHEFDYGWEKIREFVAVAGFPTVSANVVDADGDTLVLPYAIEPIGDIEVAIVGALTERLLDLTVSDSLGPWRAAPLVESLAPVVQEVAGRVDLVIVLGHLSRGEPEAILRGIPEVDVVVAGHSHRGWDEARVIDGRLAVHASGYGRDLGRLRLRFDPDADRILDHDWSLLPVEGSAIDEQVRARVAEWESRVAEIVDVPIGRASRTLAGSDVQEIFEAAMREQTGADFAYMNRGGVRDVFPQGELLARHVWNAMPFDNRVVVAELSGSTLRSLPAAGEDDPLLGDGSVDANRTYRFATIDFVAAGWRDRGFDLGFVDTGVLLRDVIIDWVRRRGTVP